MLRTMAARTDTLFLSQHKTPIVERCESLYSDGHGGLIQVEVVIASPEAWPDQPEASQDGWTPHRVGPLVLALRVA